MRIVVHDYAGHPFQFDLSRALAARGHAVGHFYFAGDAGPKGATGRLSDDPETYSVHPIHIGRSYSKTQFIRRALGDMEYGRQAGRQIAAFRPDVVLSANTPLEAQRHILKAARDNGSAFAFWMQDFYSLAVSRLLRNRWLGAGWLVSLYYLALERSLLSKGDAIVYISPDFSRSAGVFKLKNVISRVILNWASIKNLPLREKVNPWSVDQNLSDKFVFLYSGTLALKHDPSLLLELAKRYSGRSDVVVVVAAHGVGRDMLETELARDPLPNLKLLPLQPFDQLPNMFGAADVLIALLEEDAGEFSVPSKVLSYYCAGRPLLMSSPSGNLASRTTVEEGCGLVAAPGDTPSFLDFADQLLTDADLRSRLGRQARRYAEDNFDIESITDEFERVLNDAVRSHRRRGAQAPSAPASK